ncbi:MAG: PAS domain-containing sensor histidine kinase [Candidatus Pacebacteria bacterium]|nr:PAS domain-containing sensor histidine kinase [Candidatus Paceibacterota bacterium]
MTNQLIIIAICSWAACIALASYIIVKHFRDKTRLQDMAIVPKEVEWLSVSREQFKKLFEEAPVAYFILNKRGEIKDINKAGLRFFNAVPEEIMLKNLFSYATEEDADYAGYLMTCCTLGTPINKKELRMAPKKGDPRWVHLSVLPLTESSGSENRSSLATIFDITEQKNLDQAKTEFVSLASHQLRAPLATVKWYSEMLSNPNVGVLNQKQREYVKTIEEVNTDMIDLVDTLLNVSRIEIGKLVVDLKPTNVQELVDSILTELSSQIEKKKMNMVKQYSASTLTNINSDPRLLRIVIHNLITNAIKYTLDGGTIAINLMESAGKSQITVSDTGYGIPKDQQNKIFTKLFRADNVKEISSSQSTGLGLYLVKSMVEAMGGSISFESVENKGTTFTVAF